MHMKTNIAEKVREGLSCCKEGIFKAGLRG